MTQNYNYSFFPSDRGKERSTRSMSDEDDSRGKFKSLPENIN